MAETNVGRGPTPFGMQVVGYEVLHNAAQWRPHTARWQHDAMPMFSDVMPGAAGLHELLTREHTNPTKHTEENAR